MTAPHVYARLEWLRSAGVKRSCAATSASLARAESGGTRLAGSMELRRPECIRSTIARRPASMLSSPRSRGRASVTHSRAVSTPPVRSVHPMDPIGSEGRGGLMEASQFSDVAIRWRNKRADEPPSRRRGPRALVSISVSPIGATRAPRRGTRPRVALTLSSLADCKRERLAWRSLQRTSDRGGAARDDYRFEARAEQLQPGLAARHETYIDWFIDSGDRFRRALDAVDMAQSDDRRRRSRSANVRPLSPGQTSLSGARFSRAKLYWRSDCYGEPELRMRGRRAAVVLDALRLAQLDSASGTRDGLPSAE